MDKLKILLIMDDEMLMDVISLGFLTEYKNHVSITQISSMTYLETFKNNVHFFDMLVVSESFYDGWMSDKIVVQTVIVLSSQIGAVDQFADATVLNPYMGVKELYASINSKVVLHDQLKSALDKTTKIVLFYAPSGGVGTTTVALNMCKELATYGKRVLYFNFEKLQSHHDLVEGGKTASSHFVSRIQKSDLGDLAAEVSRSSEQFDIVLPFSAPLSYLNLTIDQLFQCAVTMKKQNTYDYIVIDSESDFSKEKVQMMEQSDQIILVTSSNVQALNKLLLLSQNIECCHSERFKLFVTTIGFDSLNPIKETVDKLGIGYVLGGDFKMADLHGVKSFDNAIKDMSLKIQ